MKANLALCFAMAGLALGADVDWPVNGGPNNIRYSALSQITRANVSQLKVAWSYDSHDAFKGSEMQSNPIVVDGVLYATTPKLRVIALDAATGREVWSFGPWVQPVSIRNSGLSTSRQQVSLASQPACDRQR